MARLMIILEQDEREALRRLAMNEKRTTRAQAALLIRESLERRGLLAVNTVMTQPRDATAQGGDYAATG